MQSTLKLLKEVEKELKFISIHHPETNPKLSILLSKISKEIKKIKISIA